MIESEATQSCRTCGELKPIEEFDVRADTGRRRTQCKACRREYQLRRYRLVAPESSRWTRIIGAAELFLCIRCQEMRPAEAFPTRASGSVYLHSWCKSCFAKYKADRHQRHHEREMRRIRRNQARIVRAHRTLIHTYLLSHPCVDCGETDPIVLDFDHVRGKKLAEVSKLIANGHRWERIQEEIDKCEVRCANDHRRVTALRRERDKRDR